MCKGLKCLVQKIMKDLSSTTSMRSLNNSPVSLYLNRLTQQTVLDGFGHFWARMFFESTSLLNSLIFSIYYKHQDPTPSERHHFFTTKQFKRSLFILVIRQQKHIGSTLKIIISIDLLPMKNRFKFYHELRSNIANLRNTYFDYQGLGEDCDSNYQTAKEILMSIPDDNFGEKVQLVDLRGINNGSDITRWNQQRQLTNNKENQVKFKKTIRNRCRHISSQNSFVQNQHSQFSIGYSLKRELNKLQLPLKEKNINQLPFRNSERDKERNKTRNQIKLDIINSKFQLAPTIPKRKKTQAQHNYENVVKMKTENNNYQRIRRKGLFTIELEQQQSRQETIIKNLSRTREKTFFLKNQLDNIPRFREKSVHHILACLA